jgi:nucleoside-diphosphate-sugar epimerase
LIALLDSDVTGPVNIGDPTEFTMLEFARLVIEMTGSTSEVVFRPLPTDDPKLRRPDISLARSALGWRPTTPLAEGLRRTIEAFAS